MPHTQYEELLESLKLKDNKFRDEYLTSHGVWDKFDLFLRRRQKFYAPILGVSSPLPSAEKDDDKKLKVLPFISPTLPALAVGAITSLITQKIPQLEKEIQQEREFLKTQIIGPFTAEKFLHEIQNNLEVREQILTAWKQALVTHITQRLEYKGEIDANTTSTWLNFIKANGNFRVVQAPNSELPYFITGVEAQLAAHNKIKFTAFERWISKRGEFKAWKTQQNKLQILLQNLYATPTSNPLVAALANPHHGTALRKACIEVMVARGRDASQCSTASINEFIQNAENREALCQHLDSRSSKPLKKLRFWDTQKTQEAYKFAEKQLQFYTATAQQLRSYTPKDNAQKDSDPSLTFNLFSDNSLTTDLISQYKQQYPGKLTYPNKSKQLPDLLGRIFKNKTYSAIFISQYFNEDINTYNRLEDSKKLAYQTEISDYFNKALNSEEDSQVIINFLNELYNKLLEDKENEHYSFCVLLKNIQSYFVNLTYHEQVTTRVSSHIEGDFNNLFELLLTHSTEDSPFDSEVAAQQYENSNATLCASLKMAKTCLQAPYTELIHSTFVSQDLDKQQAIADQIEAKQKGCIALLKIVQNKDLQSITHTDITAMKQLVPAYLFQDYKVQPATFITNHLEYHLKKALAQCDNDFDKITQAKMIQIYPNLIRQIDSDSLIDTTCERLSKAALQYWTDLLRISEEKEISYILNTAKTQLLYVYLWPNNAEAFEEILIKYLSTYEGKDEAYASLMWFITDKIQLQAYIQARIGYLLANPPVDLNNERLTDTFALLDKIKENQEGKGSCAYNALNQQLEAYAQDPETALDDATRKFIEKYGNSKIKQLFRIHQLESIIDLSLNEQDNPEDFSTLAKAKEYTATYQVSPITDTGVFDEANHAIVQELFRKKLSAQEQLRKNKSDAHPCSMKNYWTPTLEELFRHYADDELKVQLHLSKLTYLFRSLPTATVEIQEFLASLDKSTAVFSHMAPDGVPVTKAIQFIVNGKYQCGQAYGEGSIIYNQVVSDFFNDYMAQLIRTCSFSASYRPERWQAFNDYISENKEDDYYSFESLSNAATLAKVFAGPCELRDLRILYILKLIQTNELARAKEYLTAPLCQSLLEKDREILNALFAWCYSPKECKEPWNGTTAYIIHKLGSETDQDLYLIKRINELLTNNDALASEAFVVGLGLESYHPLVNTPEGRAALFHIFQMHMHDTWEVNVALFLEQYCDALGPEFQQLKYQYARKRLRELLQGIGHPYNYMQNNKDFMEVAPAQQRFYRAENEMLTISATNAAWDYDTDFKETFGPTQEDVLAVLRIVEERLASDIQEWPEEAIVILPRIMADNLHLKVSKADQAWAQTIHNQWEKEARLLLASLGKLQEYIADFEKDIIAKELNKAEAKVVSAQKQKIHYVVLQGMQAKASELFEQFMAYSMDEELKLINFLAKVVTQLADKGKSEALVTFEAEGLTNSTSLQVIEDLTSLPAPQDKMEYIGNYLANYPVNKLASADLKVALQPWQTCFNVEKIVAIRLGYNQDLYQRFPEVESLASLIPLSEIDHHIAILNYYLNSHASYLIDPAKYTIEYQIAAKNLSRLYIFRLIPSLSLPEHMYFKEQETPGAPFPPQLSLSVEEKGQIKLLLKQLLAIYNMSMIAGIYRDGGVIDALSDETIDNLLPQLQQLLLVISAHEQLPKQGNERDINELESQILFELLPSIFDPIIGKADPIKPEEIPVTLRQIGIKIKRQLLWQTAQALEKIKEQENTAYYLNKMREVFVKLFASISEQDEESHEHDSQISFESESDSDIFNDSLLANASFELPKNMGHYHQQIQQQIQQLNDALTNLENQSTSVLQLHLSDFELLTRSFDRKRDYLQRTKNLRDSYPHNSFVYKQLNLLTNYLIGKTFDQNEWENLQNKAARHRAYHEAVCDYLNLLTVRISSLSPIQIQQFKQAEDKFIEALRFFVQPEVMICKAAQTEYKRLIQALFRRGKSRTTKKPILQYLEYTDLVRILNVLLKQKYAQHQMEGTSTLDPDKYAKRYLSYLAELQRSINAFRQISYAVKSYLTKGLLPDNDVDLTSIHCAIKKIKYQVEPQMAEELEIARAARERMLRGLSRNLLANPEVPLNFKALIEWANPQPAQINTSQENTTETSTFFLQTDEGQSSSSEVSVMSSTSSAAASLLASSYIAPRMRRHKKSFSLSNLDETQVVELAKVSKTSDVGSSSSSSSSIESRSFFKQNNDAPSLAASPHLSPVGLKRSASLGSVRPGSNK